MSAGPISICTSVGNVPAAVRQGKTFDAGHRRLRTGISSADAVTRQARLEWSWESALALFPSWEWEPEALEISSHRKPPGQRFRSLNKVRI